MIKNQKYQGKYHFKWKKVDTFQPSELSTGMKTSVPSGITQNEIQMWHELHWNDWMIGSRSFFGFCSHSLFLDMMQKKKVGIVFRVSFRNTGHENRNDARTINTDHIFENYYSWMDGLLKQVLSFVTYKWNNIFHRMVDYLYTCYVTVEIF